MTAVAAPATALAVEALTVGYGPTTVLRDVALTVPQGGVVALLGPNGAGKTTLLRAISGLMPVQSGSLHLAGVDASGLSAHERAARGLVHIPEGRGIFRSLTVIENIRIQSFPGEESDAVERAVSAFPILGERLSQRAGTLSGGQQQMLAMASAYVRRPSLLVVDEASLGLAPIVIDEIFAFLADRAREGVSLLLVDQFVDRVLALAMDAYILRKGRIVFAGSAEHASDIDLFATYVGEGGTE